MSETTNNEMTANDTIQGLVALGVMIWIGYSWYSAAADRDCLTTNYKAGNSYEAAKNNCNL